MVWRQAHRYVEPILNRWKLPSWLTKTWANTNNNHPGPDIQILSQASRSSVSSLTLLPPLSDWVFREKRSKHRWQKSEDETEIFPLYLQITKLSISLKFRISPCFYCCDVSRRLSDVGFKFRMALYLAGSHLELQDLIDLSLIVKAWEFYRGTGK